MRSLVGTADASGSEAFAYLFGSNNRCDEAISLPGHGLYESWGLGVILQRLTKLADRTPDAVVGIEENILGPKSARRFGPG